MSLADQPAFPRGRVVDHNGVFEAAEQEGMTYRQWLVGMALQGLLANTGVMRGVISETSKLHPAGSDEQAQIMLDVLAGSAAAHADAAIRAQEK